LNNQVASGGSMTGSITGITTTSAVNVLVTGRLVKDNGAGRVIKSSVTSNAATCESL
jgi:hypothetical protein